MKYPPHTVIPIPVNHEIIALTRLCVPVTNFVLSSYVANTPLNISVENKNTTQAKTFAVILNTFLNFFIYLLNSF